jgi:hypothetical protein
MSDENQITTDQFMRTIQAVEYDRARQFWLDVWNEQTAPRYAEFTVAVAKLSVAVAEINQAVLFKPFLIGNAFQKSISGLSPRLSTRTTDYENKLAILTGKTDTENKSAVIMFVGTVQEAVQHYLANGDDSRLTGLFSGEYNEDFIQYLSAVDFGGRPKSVALQWIRNRNAYLKEHKQGWLGLRNTIKFDNILSELTDLAQSGKIVSDDQLLAFQLMTETRKQDYAGRGEKLRDWMRDRSGENQLSPV